MSSNLIDVEATPRVIIKKMKSRKYESTRFTTERLDEYVRKNDDFEFVFARTDVLIAHYKPGHATIKFFGEGNGTSLQVYAYSRNSEAENKALDSVERRLSLVD